MATAVLALSKLIERPLVDSGEPPDREDTCQFFQMEEKHVGTGIIIVDDVVVSDRRTGQLSTIVVGSILLIGFGQLERSLLGHLCGPWSVPDPGGFEHSRETAQTGVDDVTQDPEVWAPRPYD